MLFLRNISHGHCMAIQGHTALLPIRAAYCCLLGRLLDFDNVILNFVQPNPALFELGQSQHHCVAQQSRSTL